MDKRNGGQGLSPADISVLRVLVKNEGRVVSRESLVRMAGLDSSSARRVDVSLVTIRRVLGPDTVRTVRSRGWILTDLGLSVARIALGDALDISE